MSSQIYRTSRGMSLIEMLSTMFIMTFVAAAITEICVTQNVVAFRTNNKLGALLSAKRVVATMEREVHNARFFGDQFGTLPNKFPGGGLNNPYGASGPSDPNITDFTGFPATTTNSVWPGPPYALSSSTLIIQIPIYTSDGFPTLSQSNTWNVDTIVYQVLPDTSKPGKGQFVLQKSIFPGEHSGALYQPMPPGSSSLPQTVLTGLVGPIDPAGAINSAAGAPTPQVFQYLSKQHPLYSGGQTVIDVPSSTDPPNLNGVAINVEVLSTESSTRSDLIPSSMAFRQEAYVRTNYSADSNNRVH